MSLKQLILDSKPINLYGYTIIIYVSVFAVGFAIEALKEDLKPGVFTVIAITLLVPILSQLYRFYRCRNNKIIRQRLEETESSDEIVSLIFGGKVYGLSTFIIMGVTFFLALNAFVL